jgi:hypothetical protein
MFDERPDRWSTSQSATDICPAQSHFWLEANFISEAKSETLDGSPYVEGIRYSLAWPFAPVKLPQDPKHRFLVIGGTCA